MNPVPVPGKPPTVTAVIAFLKAAGFQHSRYTESMSRGAGSGAFVRRSGFGRVAVFWNEGDGQFFHRMAQLGITDARGMPRDPQAAVRAQDYAEALASRYTVEVSGTWVFVSAREELPARPPRIPKAMIVRKALVAARVIEDVGQSSKVSVVDQPDHTRVAVGDDVTLPAVVASLTAEGWIFEQFKTVEHFGIKITGSAPDRRARLRKLRAVQAANECPSEPVPAPTKAETSEDSTVIYNGLQDGHVEVGSGGAPIYPPATARTLVEQSSEDQAAPAEEAPAVPDVPLDQEQPLERLYSGGTLYAPGVRVTYRARDGFWLHGVVQDVFATAHERKPAVRIMVDTRQVAPPRRPQRFMSDRPGKRRSDTSTGVLTVALDDKNLSLERTEQ